MENSQFLGIPIPYTGIYVSPDFCGILLSVPICEYLTLRNNIIIRQYMSDNVPLTI